VSCVDGTAPVNLFGAELDFWHVPCMAEGGNVLGGLFTLAVYCLIIYKSSTMLADALQETLESHCGNAKLIAGLVSPVHVVGAMPDTILTIIFTITKGLLPGGCLKGDVHAGGQQCAAADPTVRYRRDIGPRESEG
jgi:hypothetical protein